MKKRYHILPVSQQRPIYIHLQIIIYIDANFKTLCHIGLYPVEMTDMKLSVYCDSVFICNGVRHSLIGNSSPTAVKQWRSTAVKHWCCTAVKQ